MKRSPLNRRGKKAIEYDKAKKIGDLQITKYNITSCELAFPGCLGGLFLQRVHRKKRRFCDFEELCIYAIGCTFCHRIAEEMTHEQMFDIVDLAIRNRESNL